MAAQILPGGSNQNLKDAIGVIPTQTPPTFFNTPAFRTKIVEILAQTANGCLKELNYHPRMAQEITDLQKRIAHYREENTKLYDDNRQLLSMVREAKTKLGAYSSTINQLEQQVAHLHKVNQDILMRERNLAVGVGNSAYNQLHSEFTQLSGYCAQLKQQIGALQRMVLEKPALQRGPGPVQQPYVISIAEGGQSLPTKQPEAHSTQRLVWKTQEHANRVQPHTISLGQEFGGSNPSVSRPSIGTRPGPPIQPNINISASQRPGSTPSQLVTFSSDMTQIRASDAASLMPKIKGWMNYSSPHTVEIQPRVQNSSSPVASVHRWRSVSAQHHSPPSLSTAGSIVAQINSKTLQPANRRSLDVNVPPGMNFVPIGPPGKFLPPLAASVIKPPSPVSRPPSARAPSPSRSIRSPEHPPTAEVVNPPPLNTSVRFVDHSRTPVLTPTSSRNSVAPSEGELEATTPLDDHVNHTVKVVKSPVNDVGVENSMMVMEEAITTSSLKRSSLHMHDGEGGNSSDVGESARKRFKTSEEDLPSERDEDGKTISMNSSSKILEDDAVDEEEEEEEEEDEFGPDGKRSVGYCLDVFTEEDGDVIVCSLCRLRQESGLISAPTTFSPDTAQETKVQHFLDEHPTAWENMITGRGCS